MKIRYVLPALFLWLLSFSFSSSANDLYIQEGVLDLRYTEIDKFGSIKLQGDWEFYWKQLISPSEFQNQTLNAKFDRVPKSWSSYTDDEGKLPSKGFATYRLRIQKQPDSTLTLYGLKISSVFSNYKLWVNGKLLSEVGKVGITDAFSKPKFKYQDIPFVLDPRKENTGTIEIVMQVSNFSHRRAGLQKPIFFGTFEHIKSQTRWMDILNLIIIGIILIIGVNHLYMYLYRKKAISNLYFSIVCLVMILRNITTGDRILTYVFPDLNWELLVKLDNFSGFGTIPLFALFFYSLYKSDFPVFMRNIILVIGSVITLLVFFTPAFFYGKFRMFYELYILIFGLYLTFGVLLKATIKRRETAFYTFLGMFILYATAINDVLSSMGLIQSAYIAPYGLVAFMLIQSITITVKSAKAINQNEKLSDELKVEKENLEKRIHKRTQELQKQHDELIVHKEKEEEQKWINDGLNEINNLLADNKNDFKELSSKVLSQLVKYVNASFGVLYMLNKESDSDENYLELIADYGCSNDIRKDKAQLHVTTGILGVAYTENRLMVVNDVPENYIKIESGLGNAQPESLLVVPLSVDEKVFGIIEIAGFHKFKKLEVEFIKRIAFNVANNLNTIRMNENNAELISKFKEQAQEMREKEEEMRQNMEEMETIREQYEELLKKNEKSN